MLTDGLLGHGIPQLPQLITGHFLERNKSALQGQGVPGVLPHIWFLESPNRGGEHAGWSTRSWREAWTLRPAPAGKRLYPKSLHSAFGRKGKPWGLWPGGAQKGAQRRAEGKQLLPLGQRSFIRFLKAGAPPACQGLGHLPEPSSWS